MGDTETTLGETLDDSKVALVLGSEGDGMRHNVMEHCDVLARLPISPRMQSLNISNAAARSEEHTSELQSLMRISYAVFCLKNKTNQNKINDTQLTPYSQNHNPTMTHLT